MFATVAQEDFSNKTTNNHIQLIDKFDFLKIKKFQLYKYKIMRVKNKSKKDRKYLQ